jgi:hypothetical protein
MRNDRSPEATDPLSKSQPIQTVVEIDKKSTDQQTRPRDEARVLPIDRIACCLECVGSTCAGGDR